MKVYAHFREEGGRMFRWRTLLQFGDSWQVVGSVVMKNPGSAYPLTPNQCVSDMFILPELQAIDDSEPWYEFKPDITMSCITRLFGVQSGVIQIFNLFNIREADLAQALHLYDEASPCVFTQQTNPHPSSLIPHTSSLISPPSSLTSPPSSILLSTTEQDISQLEGPVYLGWGPLGSDGRFRQKAQMIFDAVKDRMNYLNPDFDSNPFFHPLYLMQYGAKKPEVVEVKRQFEEAIH